MVSTTLYTFNTVLLVLVRSNNVNVCVEYKTVFNLHVYIYIYMYNYVSTCENRIVYAHIYG